MAGVTKKGYSGLVCSVSTWSGRYAFSRVCRGFGFEGIAVTTKDLKDAAGISRGACRGGD